MKKPIFLLLLVSVLSGIAGWQMAWRHEIHRRQELAEQTEFAALAESRREAARLTRFVRDADEVEFWYDSAKRTRMSRLSDPAWFSRLSTILKEASYTPTLDQPRLMVVVPIISFLKNKVVICSLMTGGSSLMVYGEPRYREFIVGQETTRAIDALVRENEALPAEP